MENQLNVRRLLGLLVCISGTLVVQGQRYYAGLNMGKGWSYTEHLVAIEGQSSLTWPSTRDQHSIRASFAEGWRGNLLVGYRPDTVSFFEVGLHTWKIDPIFWRHDHYRFNPGSLPYALSSYSLYSGSLYLSFSYGLNYKMNRKLAWFAKAGVMAGKTWIQGNARTIAQDSSHLPIYEYYTQYEYRTRLSAGGIASTGITYQASERITISAEGFLQVMQTSVRSRHIRRYEVDKVDMTHTLSSEMRDTEYYNGKPIQSVDPVNKNQSLNVSQNAVGFNVGVQYHF